MPSPRKALALAVLCGGLLLCADAQALRCGTKLIRVGDDAYKVLQRCGEPDFVTERQVYRFARRTRGDRNRFFRSEETVHVEEWTYNRGRYSFSRRLVFENGRLVSIERLDYGD